MVRPGIQCAPSRGQLGSLNSTTRKQGFAWFVSGAGGKGYFLPRSPRRDFDTRPSVPRIRRGRLCAVRVSRLKLTRRTKKGCRNFAPRYSTKGQVGNALGAWFLFFNPN